MTCPETLRLLTDALEEAGMTVLVAREGEHALSIAEKVVPDVILMDALMPGTDGFATCRRLKQNKALAHVPVIFMTGLTDTEHIIKGLEAGGVDYISKPIVPGELLARIRVHLANARMAHSARTALDAFGRFLLATSHTGRMLWYTPQAAKLLGVAFADFDTRRLRAAARCPGVVAPMRGADAGLRATSDRFNGPQFAGRDAADLHRANRRRTNICCA